MLSNMTMLIVDLTYDKIKNHIIFWTVHRRIILVGNQLDA
jgi:hypothetical protein